jgi:hypothetical protein
MILPGETEAGSAGMQPCRGIAWWAHRDDDRERGSSPLALFQNCIGSKDPHALKIPARRAECSLTGNALFPLHAESRQACATFLHQTSKCGNSRRRQECRRGRLESPLHETIRLSTKCRNSSRRLSARFTYYRPTPTPERLASEESAYPASVAGRRNGCIRG